MQPDGHEARPSSLPRTRRMAPFALLFVLVAVSATALAVPVRGKVELAAPAASEDEATHEFYWRVWNGVVDPRPARAEPPRELSVILVGGAAAEPVGCNHSLRGGDFMPETMAVRPGTALRIENRDGCSHELHAEDIPDFLPLATSPGNTRDINVPEGGPYHISDRLYAHVRGVVHAVEDLAACAAVGDDGSFVFEGVPAGTYTLQVLRGEEVAHQAEVSVSEGEPLTIDPIAVGAAN